MKLSLVTIAVLLTWIPCHGGTLSFQLLPGPDLNALPGGTLSWKLRIENDNTAKQLQLDNVSWTVALDAAQGSSDSFVSFSFPILAAQSGPPTVEIDPLLSVTWLAGATPGYAPTPGNIIISSSFCDDNQGNGCVANPDVLLPVTLSVATALPAPTCTYSLSANSESFGPASGSDTVILSATATVCPWSGSSDSSWLKIASAVSGTGNAAINFTVDANPSASPRQGTLTIAGQMFVVNQGPATAVLQVAMSHVGSFTQGQNGAAFTVTVSNATGAQPTSGTVTVMEIVPVGMTLASMNGGSTWNCSVLPACTTSVVLNGGASYPAIAVTVNVASNAATQLTNQVSVSGGGSGTATAGDVTAISPFTCEVTGDGTTNVADVQFEINEALGITPAGNDLTHDGLVNVADVQKVINAALGLGCPY
jgi:hypothetical protein